MAAVDGTCQATSSPRSSFWVAPPPGPLPVRFFSQEAGRQEANVAKCTRPGFEHLKPGVLGPLSPRWATSAGVGAARPGPDGVCLFPGNCVVAKRDVNGCNRHRIQCEYVCKCVPFAMEAIDAAALMWTRLRQDPAPTFVLEVSSLLLRSNASLVEALAAKHSSLVDRASSTTLRLVLNGRDLRRADDLFRSLGRPRMWPNPSAEVVDGAHLGTYIPLDTVSQQR